MPGLSDRDPVVGRLREINWLGCEHASNTICNACLQTLVPDRDLYSDCFTSVSLNRNGPFGPVNISLNYHRWPDANDDDFARVRTCFHRLTDELVALGERIGYWVLPKEGGWTAFKKPQTSMSVETAVEYLNIRARSWSIQHNQPTLPDGFCRHGPVQDPYCASCYNVLRTTIRNVFVYPFTPAGIKPEYKGYFTIFRDAEELPDFASLIDWGWDWVVIGSSSPTDYPTARAWILRPLTARPHSIRHTPRPRRRSTVISQTDFDAACKFDPEDLPPGRQFTLPLNRNRPMRMVSIETEVMGSAHFIANALYRAGLISTPNQNPYSYKPERTNPKPAVFKRDSTVSGGEVVSYLLNPHNTTHMGALMRTLEVLKGCESVGAAYVNRMCGGHIHVDARGLRWDGLYALAKLFQRDEVALYVLAGAGPDRKHRMQQGNNMGSPDADRYIDWEEHEFRRASRHFNRSGLNFTPIVDTVNECENNNWLLNECGANCNCGGNHLATVEFRLWNATLNPRILRTFISMSTAYVAYAERMVTLKPGLASDLKYFDAPYRAEALDILVCREGYADAIRNSLRFWFSLPTSISEKEDLLYTLRQTEFSGWLPEGLNFITEAEAMLERAKRRCKNTHGFKHGKKPVGKQARVRRVRVDKPDDGRLPTVVEDDDDYGEYGDYEYDYSYEDNVENYDEVDPD
jgi:hypothetical protein